MEDCIATRDALVVKKLKSLGAVVAGKNNMHELSFGITSVNPHWGTVGNPVAPGHLAGGSSGGCAAQQLWQPVLSRWRSEPTLVAR
ncbi:Asp-tRNA(Asn)/Glu-tRNA(Gln) amidotransferase A subunit family amidase [Paraburkholderia youngii]